MIGNFIFYLFNSAVEQKLNLFCRVAWSGKSVSVKLQKKLSLCKIPIIV